MGPIADELRGLLLSPEEAAALDVHGRIDAAVLVPLYVHDGELHAVFTKRREDLRRHAGEISFPGGRQDIDEEDLRTTALREAEEEIGLPRDAVELVGALQPTPTVVTNYAIYPFVGADRARPPLAPVRGRGGARCIELSLPALRAGFERRRLVRRGVPFRSDTYTVGEHFIWGATGTHPRATCSSASSRCSSARPPRRRRARSERARRHSCGGRLSARLRALLDRHVRRGCPTRSTSRRSS